MPNLSQEAEIAYEIDRLRGEFPKTQDLYREVCVLLFFRYGVTPTTNRLYQLVRKGSMSAPGAALNAFWKQLRDSSRVSIVAPEVPERLREAAGQLVVAFWKDAQQAAEDAFSAHRAETQTHVDEARMALSAADELVESRRQLLERKEVELAAEKRTNLELVSQVSAQKNEIELLEDEVAVAKRETAAISTRLEEAYGMHAKEIQATNAAAAQLRDRLVADERRFLLELDRERTATAKVQKLLASEQASRRLEVEKLHGEASALHSDAGSLRQSIGLLEGQLKAAHKSQSEVAAALQARNVELANLTERCIRVELKLERQVSEKSLEASTSEKSSSPVEGRAPRQRGASRSPRKTIKSA